jgi:transcriptional regulator with XRE-family HTH domain
MMYESLPAKLRLLRARAGLTLVEAAAKTGVGRDTLSDLERGHRHPVMPTLAKIAAGYGVDVEDLLEEELAAPLAEAPAGTGLHAVSFEDLAVLGIDKPVTDSELATLNSYLEILSRGEVRGPLARDTVAGDDVDHCRVTLLAIYVLTKSGKLSPEETIETVNALVYGELAASGG